MKAAAKTCLLLDLSHDEVSIVTHELCDPLQPLLAVHLSSTAKGLREAMEEQLAELKQQRQAAAALAVLAGKAGCAQLRDASRLVLGARWNKVLNPAHWRTLGTLARCGSLPELKDLDIFDSDIGDEGVGLLAAGLRRGGLPSLEILGLYAAHIGPQGATALAPALNKRALPLLESLSLGCNEIGDAGMTALAPALRQLPKLKRLGLCGTRIGSRGLAALLAPPTERVLRSLEMLDLRSNQIADDGLATFASALGSGGLPALKILYVNDNPASKEARVALRDQARARREDFYVAITLN
jgi:hypothetical protein